MHRWTLASTGLVVLLASCGGVPVSRTADTGTSTPRVTVIAVAPSVTATAVPESPSPTRPESNCGDPNITPIATTATPTPEPGATVEPATPTPIRIAHPAGVPPLPSPTAARTPATATPEAMADAELERLVRERLGADASHYAVVMENLNDGRTVSIDADRVFYAASLFKLEVMYEIFHQRDAGILSFDEEYVASDYYSGFDLGPHVVALCEQVSVGTLVAAMMSVSDNVAAVMLQDRAGAGNINAAMAGLGLEDTRLTEDGSLPATASDLARLVEAIARGTAVGADASGAMARLMATEESNDRIPAHLPPGTLAEHKTGNFTGATHDAGIVHGKKGTYVMVLMSDLGFDSDAAAVEADVAKIAFDYFER